MKIEIKAGEEYCMRANGTYKIKSGSVKLVTDKGSVVAHLAHPSSVEKVANQMNGWKLIPNWSSATLSYR